MFNSLKTSINNTITSNSNKEITAELDRSVRIAMVEQLGAYEYGGKITEPTTDTPSAADRKTYWFETAGTWVNFGNVETLDNEVGFLYKPDGEWLKVVVVTIGETVTTKVCGLCEMQVLGELGGEGGSVDYTDESNIVLPMNITTGGNTNVAYVDTNASAVNMPKMLIDSYVTISASMTISQLQIPTSARLSVYNGEEEVAYKIIDINNPITIEFSAIRRVFEDDEFSLELTLDDSQDFSVKNAYIGIIA